MASKAQIRAEMEALIAGGAKVRRIPEGAGIGMTDRQWYRAARDPIERKIDPTEIRRVASRDHLGRDIIVNGLGEIIACE